MNLAVSNIAWKPEERLGAYELMQAAGFTGLEIAPGLFFSQASDPFWPDHSTAAAAMAEINCLGISLVSMQSLLFGVHGASLFGDRDALSAFERGMNRAIDLAGRFRISNLVFGSPTQRRIPAGMTLANASAHAAEIFFRLGERAKDAGTMIAIEPNPSAYGANFLTTLDEALSFVSQVAHPSIALNLDLGAMHMNGAFESVADRIGELAPVISHVHVSEPMLAPAPDDRTCLAPVLAALRAIKYRRSISIEMKRDDGGLATLQSRIAALRRACNEEPK